MKALFTDKARFQIRDINARANAQYVLECEQLYAERIGALVDASANSGCRIVMLSGPSGSGKTTSSHRIAGEFARRGHRAVVVSLDNFFKNIDQYPKMADGRPDFEHVGALDIECIHRSLEELVQEGRSVLPTFDFTTQHRSDVTETVELGEGDIALVEGIHALNPLLSETLPKNSVFNVYVGLRAEFYEGDTRVVATRDLRIIRRLVRDNMFRGYSVENTLSVWDGIMQGEERWIKPFKEYANYLLDSSFGYEPCVFLPVMQALCANEQEGGAYRETLLRLFGCLSGFTPLALDVVPANAMLREFLGGLTL